MKICQTVVAAVIFAGVACVQSASANTVLSENFDELGYQSSATSVGAFSTIGGTNVDVVAPGWFGELCAGPESGSCIDLGGSSGNANGILQSNNSFAPGNYLLSFDLIGSGRGQTDTTTVTFGNYTQTFTLASGDVTDGIVIDAPVTFSTGFLTFSEAAPDGNPNIGNVLDNVLIQTASVPEPLTLSLFGVGLFGAAVLRRRKKAAV